MPGSLRRLPVLVAAVIATAGCARPTRAAGAPGADLSCLQLVDTSGRRSTLSLRWRTPADRALPSCDHVGPAVAATADPGVTAAVVDEMVVASWNVHIGAGRLSELVRQIRTGQLTQGRAPTHFILLLQEAVRGRGEDDVDAVAARDALSLLYVPSLSNSGHRDALSDRGNAILSTLPLGDFDAIALPMARQRRIAVAATVSVPLTTGVDRISLVSAHLDASTDRERLFLFTAEHRELQARALVEAVGNHDGSAVIGADLNTWSGGTREAAWRVLHTAFPRVVAGAPYRGRYALDYVFLRLPAHWEVAEGRAPSNFGSDHRPIVFVLRPA